MEYQVHYVLIHMSHLLVLYSTNTNIDYCDRFYNKWEDTIKSITQVYLQQIRIKKNTNNYKKQAKQSHPYYYQ